jgi:hypothetical protein
MRRNNLLVRIPFFFYQPASIHCLAVSDNNQRIEVTVGIAAEHFDQAITSLLVFSLHTQSPPTPRFHCHTSPINLSISIQSYKYFPSCFSSFFPPSSHNRSSLPESWPPVYLLRRGWTGISTAQPMACHLGTTLSSRLISANRSSSSRCFIVVTCSHP